MRTLILSLLLVLPVWAELPSPRLDRISVSGAGTGTTIEMILTGNDLDDVKQLLFSHPGIKAELVKDKTFKVSVANDVTPGMHDLWAVGKYGISNPRAFVVSKGFSEVFEKEPNDDNTSAQPINVNTIVNAQSDNNKEDCYRVTLKKGDRITVDCYSQRIETQMDSTLSISNIDGKQLASNADYYGRDPFLDYIATTDGDVMISVADLSYRGGFNYRLVVSNKPHIENVFPRAVQAGQTTTLTLYGRNLGSTAQVSSFKIDDQPLMERTERFTANPDCIKHGRYEYNELPNAHSVLATGATCTLTGKQPTFVIDGHETCGVPMVVTEHPVTLEQEPNDDPTKPQRVTLPAIVSARFDQTRDADWYEFNTTEDGAYQFNVYCERIGGRADPYLVIMDDKDNRVQELDDFGTRQLAFDGHLRDPNGSVNLSKNKTYRVLVQDRYRRGGARYQYVLSITKSVPNFFPAVIHGQNPGPGGLNLRRGGTGHLDVVIHHADGTNNPIVITAQGLPPGIHAAPLHIHNDNRGTMVFWAAADAPEFTGPIQLIAKSKRHDQEITREVRTYTRVDSTQNIASTRPMRALYLTVRETAPFLLTPDQTEITAPAGSKVTVTMKLDRRWPDFKNAVTLIPQNFPGPIKMGNVVLAEGKNEASITLELQSGMRTGLYTVVIAGQAQVAFSKEDKSKPTNTLVSNPAKPITLTVTEAPTKKGP